MMMNVQLAGKEEFEAKHKEQEGVVNTMMTNVYQAAGGGGDRPGDMSGGGFDDAPGAGGNVHGVEVVSASRTGERSSQVQGTSLLDVTLLPEVMESTSGDSRRKQQPHTDNQQQAVQREKQEERR